MSLKIIPITKIIVVNSACNHVIIKIPFCLLSVAFEIFDLSRALSTLSSFSTELANDGLAFFNSASH